MRVFQLLWKRFKQPEFGSFLALVLLILIFASLSTHFLTQNTWASVMTSSTEIGILALGMTLLMICGEIDLSVGAIFACSGIFYAQACVNWHWPTVLAMFASLSLGTLMGILNGILTVKTKLPSFIITLGTMLFWQGCVLVATNGFPISDIEGTASLSWLSEEFIFGLEGSWLLWILLTAFLVYALKSHRLGNWILATGGHEQAAYAMGVPSAQVKVFCFALTGTLSAVAALVQFSHLESMSPISGDQYALKAIAIAVMGGTALTGGVGSILGTGLGTLIMGVLTTGLVQVGISNYWFRTFVGMMIILAVFLNGRIQKLMRVTP